MLLTEHSRSAAAAISDGDLKVKIQLIQRKMLGMGALFEKYNFFFIFQLFIEMEFAKNISSLDTIQQCFENLKVSKDRFQQEEDKLMSKTQELLNC